MRRYWFGIFLFVFLCLEIQAQPPRQEIRAVWLTTNYGLDFPDKPYQNARDIVRQQEDLTRILDRLKETHINMVFFQARLRGDVAYRSQIEPMSAYIQGRAVQTEYDPLAFAIEECHKRGLECHAWLVGYKSKRRGKDFFMDPGEPETNTYLLSLVNEVVENYDVDGIHLDYIRYPDNPAGFPDNATYRTYGQGQSKGEWRRENVNRLVYEIYDAVKKQKPWVQVSSSVIGMYDSLKDRKATHWTARSMYQDPVAWLKAGKQDFIVPMMYYGGELYFPFVRDWKERAQGYNVVPGLGIFQLDEKESGWSAGKIKEQLQYSRDNQMAGNAFYRTRFLVENKKGIEDIIRKDFYLYPALLPPLAGAGTKEVRPPVNVQASKSGNYLLLNWDAVDQFEQKIVYYNIYRSESKPVDMTDVNNLIATRVPGTTLLIPVNNAVESGYYYTVSAYDRYHNESFVSEPVYFVTGEFEK